MARQTRRDQSGERHRRSSTIRFVAGLIVVCTGLLIVAPQADAFRVNGKRWANPGWIRYAFAGGALKPPPWMIPHVHDAADTWSATPTALVLYNDADYDIYVFQYHEDSGFGGIGGCSAWDANGVCYHRTGYVGLNVGCTGNTCGPQLDTPRYNKWIVMHELGHAFGLNHSYGTQSVMSYDSCRTQAKCVSNPSYDDISGINYIYRNTWSDDAGGGGCSAIATVFGSSAAAESSASFVQQTLLTSNNTATTLAGQTLGKSRLDKSPVDLSKLTFSPTC